MANRVFQSVIYQMKDAINRVVGVVDETGAVISCSELNLIGEVREGFMAERLTAGDRFVRDGYTYQQFSSAKHNDYAVFVEGADETAGQFAAVLSISLQSIKQYHDEKFDKSNFIKNVVLDNILPGDIYAKARELHFATDVSRVVFIVRVTSGGDISAYDVVSSLFPDKQKDFVFNISETDTVLVKEIRKGIDRTDMEKLAASIVDTLSGEHYIKAVVGIGTPISNVKDLATSFKEAQIAMEVSKVFDTEKQIIRYDNLGIARLIYQLPVNLCKIFIEEIFGDNVPMDLDEETLNTLNKFFENNLNVSETSRQLFVHRNTLVYRIEKIQKSTGLDLRSFDDALTFTIALMVVNYMKYLFIRIKLMRKLIILYSGQKILGFLKLIIELDSLLLIFHPKNIWPTKLIA